MTSFLSNAFLAAFLTLSIAAPAWAAPETFGFDPSHTAVVWHANHFGFSNPSGKFTGVSGKLVLDEASPADSSVEVTIDLNSLNTGLPKFDEHLKSKDFFNVAENPTATFKSTKVTLTDKDEADVEGMLTLNGVSKPVTLDVHLNKIGEHPFTKQKNAGFSAVTKIKRSDFNISYGIPGVSDDVLIDIEVEAAPEAAAAK